MNGARSPSKRGLLLPGLETIGELGPELLRRTCAQRPRLVGSDQALAAEAESVIAWPRKRTRTVGNEAASQWLPGVDMDRNDMQPVVKLKATGGL